MNLVKINQANVNYQNNNQIICNYVPDFIGTQGEYYELLGTYKTKQRALEVLDEIQTKITQNECLKTMMTKLNSIKGEEEKIGKLFKETIYEMPKE